MKNATEREISSLHRSQSFNLQIFDLLPGTHYYEILRLSDKSGNWEYKILDFTTLKRRIRIRPTDIFIHSDGDDFSNGEGTFECIFQTGKKNDPSSWRNRGNWSWENGNFESGTSLVPAPAGEILLGPEPVNLSDLGVRLHVSGREEDGTFFDIFDDLASGSKELDLPVNTVQETVIDGSDSIEADLGDGFSFKVTYKYWVEYF
jgi:hypothetical protein